MTRRTHATSWLDVLYNSVRRTPGGISAAAAYLADRRGKSMHPETLRCKLSGREGESVSVELAELLTEWMLDHRDGETYARDWMRALAGQYGMAADVVPALERVDVHASVMQITHSVLRLSAAASAATGGTGQMTAGEASEIAGLAQELRQQALNLEMLAGAAASVQGITA